MQPVYMKMPQNEEEWKAISDQYNNLWNFPNCVGALDGKHIALKAPPNSGSQFYNYKGFYSIVLMALADARYKFIYVDIGSYGRNSDGGIFSHSSLGIELPNNTFNLPKEDLLPGGETYGPMPYVIVADEAFPLTGHIMRPYPGWKNGLPNNKAIYNYRLSRARRVVENTFGILSSRWRVLNNSITLSVDHAISVVKATTVLHNYLQATSTPYLNFVEENKNLSESFTPLKKVGNYASSHSENVRQRFMDYFQGPGSVSWQQAQVDKGSK
jgi:hypothetical protein